MKDTLASFGKQLMEAVSDSTIIKIQLGIMGTFIAVAALVTMAAVIISIVIRANPASKRKIFDFIEKM